MSQEMASQPSDDADSEPSPRSDDEMEDEEDINHYYITGEGDEHDHDRRKEDDPEYFEYQLLTVEDVERLLNESVEALSQSIKVSQSQSCDLVHLFLIYMDFINSLVGFLTLTSLLFLLIFMPLAANCRERHSVFGLSVCPSL